MRGAFVLSRALIRPILVLSLLFVACGAPSNPEDAIVYDPCRPVVIAPTETPSPTHAAALREAIALWRTAGVTALTLDAVEGAQRVPLTFRDAPEIFHGVYEPSVGEVFVNLKLTAGPLNVTIAHELGHAMGLAHVPVQERKSLMNPGNATVLPTEDDERQLRAKWSCLPN